MHNETDDLIDQLKIMITNAFNGAYDILQLSWSDDI